MTATRTEEGWRTIRHFAYVDRDFRAVRRSLAGTAGESVAELQVRRAGFDLARDVRIVTGPPELAAHCVRLPIRWEDASHPGLFPILDATLEVIPVRAGRRAMTQVALLGRYRPPFGRLGGLTDHLAGHRIVAESVERFLDDLVQRFEDDIDRT